MKPSLLLGNETHRELSDLLQKKRHLTISGASNETAKALLLSRILGFHPQPTVVVTNEGSVEGLRHWLNFFEVSAEDLFLPNMEDPQNLGRALQSFLLCMQQLHEKKVASTFLLSREIWEIPFPSYEEMEEQKLILKKGKDVPFTQFVEDLLERGYAHGNDLMIAPGEYRRIGDTLDIFPIQANSPYRISFDFDRVVEIRRVDQEDLSKTHPGGDELAIFPAV